MIAIDTSAPVAIILGERAGRDCLAVLESESEVAMSAGSLAELQAVAARRGMSEPARALIANLGIEIVNVTRATADAVGDAYRRWGKGIHPAGLNFGDCFAYVLAKEYDCPLLFVGKDFSRTDVKRAL